MTHKAEASCDHWWTSWRPRGMSEWVPRQPFRQDTKYVRAVTCKLCGTRAFLDETRERIGD